MTDRRYIEGIGDSAFDMATAKLEWGRFRLRELDDEVQRLVRDADHPIYMESDSLARTFKLVWSPASTSGHFGLRVGDVAHSLRSSLDVLVWGLSDNPESLKRPQPSFPIFDSDAAYNRDGRARVRGLEPHAQDIVRSHQPFRWPQGPPSDDPLHQLRELNNIDKHRVPNSVLIGLSWTRTRSCDSQTRSATGWKVIRTSSPKATWSSLARLLPSFVSPKAHRWR